MPEEKKTLIMKFGGSTLQDSDCFHRIADIIAKRQDYKQIVVVLSAMKGVTNRLIELAFSIHPHPPRREYDMLVSVGERISISLLAMALAAKGIEAVSLTGSQSGVITTNDHTDAKIIAVKPTRIVAALDKGQVVIVAGFQGVSEQKEITTLGRGGSDTTAVALGIALKAEVVEFYKDVEGVYDGDPHEHPNSRLFSLLDFDKAIEIITKTGGKILHPRALQLAKANYLPLHLRPFWKDSEQGTRICCSFLSPLTGPIYETATLTHCYAS